MTTSKPDNSPCIIQIGDGIYRCVNLGITIKTRRLPIRCACTMRTSPGTGDHLHALIEKDIGAKMEPGCNCPEWIAQMNAWGPAGCREHRAEIIDDMIEEAKRRKWKIDGRPLLSIAAAVGTRLLGGMRYARRWAGELVDRAINESRGNPNGH